MMEMLYRGKFVLWFCVYSNVCYFLTWTNVLSFLFLAPLLGWKSNKKANRQKILGVYLLACFMNDTHKEDIITALYNLGSRTNKDSVNYCCSNVQPTTIMIVHLVCGVDSLSGKARGPMGNICCAVHIFNLSCKICLKMVLHLRQI